MKDRYYIFNKLSDYEHGFSQNLKFEKGIGMKTADNFRNGVFYSAVFDSLEKQNLWYRLETDSIVKNNTTIRITFFSSDTSFITDENDKKIEIYDIIRSIDIQPEDKDKLFSRCISEIFVNPEDCIFRKLKGRYIWFKAELFAQQEDSPVIKKIKAHIKSKNWIDYLPEIYREKDKTTFTERFLSIFQNVYQNTERSIDEIDLLFNPDIADRDFLEWLSSWVSISDVYMWNDRQLGFLMKNAVNMYRSFGTKESISKMIELYTGEPPVIIENCNLYSDSIDENIKKLYRKLYTSNPFIFTVLIRGECIKSDMQYKTLLKIIESVKPVHMEVKLVILQHMILLDEYSYMGINTELSELSSASLDGSSSIDFTVL